MSSHSMVGRARLAGRGALMRLTIALTAALCLAMPASAAAQGTLDQQQTSTPSITLIDGPNFSGGLSQAQTFTAGLTGGLDQVDLSLRQNSATNSVGLTVEIRNVTAGGVPGGTVLGSDTIAPGAVPPVGSPLAFVSASFSPPAPVTAGVQYAIVAYTGGADRYAWGFDTSGPYAGGQPFASLASPPGAWTAIAGDHAFKTFVVTGPTSKAQCKNGGWRSFGSMFKNQGECVRLFEEDEQ